MRASRSDHEDRMMRWVCPLIVGAHVSLPAGCQVERSIVMDEARIERPIAIRDSLIFPGARVGASTDLTRVIATGDQVIDCRSGAF